jgi:type I restriction enzyme R subunit
MPVSQTNERALEECIERSLVEGSRDEKGNPADFASLIVETEKRG